MNIPSFPLCVLSCSLAAITLPACAVLPKGPVETKIDEHFAGRPDGLVERITLRDAAFGRGVYVFTDPTMNGIAAWHTNMIDIGGCSHFSAGAVTVTVDTNLVPAIGAAGTAAGNIIGASVKSAVK